MDLLYIFTGLSVVFIGLFKRELLIEKDTFRLVLWASVILFFVGVVLHFTKLERYSMCGALVIPLVSLGLFRLYRNAFLKRFKREPKDTFLNSEAGLGADMLFNFLFSMSAMFLGMLIAIGMIELAKAGW